MHPSEEVLAAVAIGDEPDRSAVEHVRTCPSCSALVEQLSDLPGQVRDAAGVEILQPQDDLWQRIAAEVGVKDEPYPTARPVETPAAGGRRRFGRGWLIGGVAAGVAIGVLAATALPRVFEPQPQLVARASLETLDTRQAQGQATVTGLGGTLELNLTVQPLNAGSGFLEVWLINTDLTRMVSVGVMPNAATQQEFPITDALIAEGYLIVDISREPFDDRPQHSGDSLLRGKLS